MKKISFSTDKGEFLLVDIPIGIKYVWMSDDFYEKVGYLKNLTEEQISNIMDDKPSLIDATYGDKLICSVCENKEEVTYYSPYLFKKI